MLALGMDKGEEILTGDDIAIRAIHDGDTMELAVQARRVSP